MDPQDDDQEVQVVQKRTQPLRNEKHELKLILTV